MIANRKRLLTVLAFIGFWSPSAWSGWPPENMVDPQDGKFDISQYLGSAWSLSK
jgi:hypothetical protein